MNEIRFPVYRIYTAARRETNNAMMALLAGSRLAAHTLQLTEGSRRLLPEMFPAVDHINRFNLQTESARSLLLNADAHLGAVAVPYALAVHEHFVMACLGMLKQAGIKLNTGKKKISAWNMHEVLFASVGGTAPSTRLDIFHLLREMRNAQIHAGGAVDARLQSAMRTVVAGADAVWTDLTGRSASQVVVGSRLVFVAGDVFAAFAVTKALGRDVNYELQRALPRAEWLALLVQDFAAQTTKERNSDRWLRSLRGYARMFYAPLKPSEAELKAAAIAHALWTR